MAAITLKLFVLGDTPRTQRAIDAIQRLCEQAGDGRCLLTVVDLEHDPEAADQYNVIAAPTLVRERPPPVRQVVGDLRDLERVQETLELDLGPGPTTPAT